MNLNYVTIKDKKVAYILEKNVANKPFLVFLHDSLGCIELWRDFPRLLAEANQCNLIIFDRLGYGKSDTFISPERALDYMEKEADFLDLFLATLGIEEALLFGHSDGGSITLIAAAKYAKRIKAIICEGAHIFVEEITLNGIREAKKAYQSTNLPEKLAKYHGDKTKALFDAWTETWLRPDFKEWNITDFLPAIKCPTLVIQGVADEFGSEQQVEGIMKDISHTEKQALLIEGAQHTPHKEAQVKTLEICRSFIEKYA